MQATRFPNKPLVDICGVPMIVRVMYQAQQAGFGDVVVACGDKQIYDVVVAHGGVGVLTDTDLPSGTDRIYQALERLGDSVDHVINVQGDIPTVSPDVIVSVYNALNDTGDADMSTACTRITHAQDLENPNVVKAYGDFSTSHITTARGFLRTVQGQSPFYHHIGLYGYTTDALHRFVSLPPSHNEIRHSLEQLRAMDAGFCIRMCLVDDVPYGVDTPEDVLVIQKMLQPES